MLKYFLQKEAALIFYIVITCIFISVMLRYGIVMRDKHKQRKLMYEGILKNISNDNKILNMVNILIDRRYDHRCNYITFQLVDKIFGVAGIVYSLLGLLTMIVSCSVIVEFIISFTAIICVIIALYLTPRDRIMQYDKSAKKLDDAILRAFSLISIYNENGINESEFLTQLGELITTAIGDSEESLDTDGV